MNTVRTRAPSPFARDRIHHPPLLITADGRRISSIAEWEERRSEIEADWLHYLGGPPYPPPPLTVRTVREDDYGSHRGILVHLQTEPDYFEQCYLMLPEPLPQGKLPAVVVFYYDIDTPSGHNLGSPNWQEDAKTKHFARHLVERGYVTLAQRWFYEGKVENLSQTFESKQEAYLAAAEREAQMAPHWKGLGRVVSDASRCVDFLLTLDFVDPARIGCMGHSLGGKMALYAGTFDRRYSVIVSSELGIGLDYSNWNDPWYLGPEVRSPEFGRDHHQLLALLAPRPFLLIGGEDADGDRSWRYINSAQDVYRLYGAEDRIGLFNHRKGHTPTVEACEAAYRWFDAYL